MPKVIRSKVLICEIWLNQLMQAIRAKVITLLGRERKDFYPEILESRFPHILQRSVAFNDPLKVIGFLEQLLLPPVPPSQGFPVEARDEISKMLELVKRDTHSLLEEKIRRARSGLSNF